MTVQQIRDLKKPIGEVLQKVGPDGLLLQFPKARYALIPLVDRLLDRAQSKIHRGVQENPQTNEGREVPDP